MEDILSWVHGDEAKNKYLIFIVFQSKIEEILLKYVKKKTQFHQGCDEIQN